MATRNERVVLTLDDHFTTPMARAAASAALLNKELDSLSRDSIRTRRSVSDIDHEVTNLGSSTQRTGREIDQYSGRLRLLAEAAAVVGPAFVPIGAVAVPAVTGLASQLGFAALGAGTAVLAFHGLGTALAAVNKAALQPTKANLEAAQLAMDKLPESAQHLVTQLRGLAPELKKLQTLAADGLLTGVSSGLTELEAAMPRIERIVSTVSDALGEIAADTGKSFASDRWAPFLAFLADEAPLALHDLSSIIGSTTHALAELWMAFTPLNEDFSTFLVDAARNFDHFAANLSKTNGFTEFTNYIRENGPQVADTLGALGNALLQIVEAAAPLGGPVLKSIEAVANALAAIANSDIGTPIFTAVAALSLLNRGLKTAEALSVFGGRLDRAGVSARRFGENLNRANLAKSALLLGGLAVAGTGAADSIGLTNTVSLGLAGSMAGPVGTALGAATGLTLDLVHANDQVTAALNQAKAAAESNSVAQVKAAQDAIQGQAAALASKGHSPLGFLAHPGDFLTQASAFASNQDQDLIRQSDRLNTRLRELQHGPLGGIGTLLTQNLGRPARQAALDIDAAATASARFSDTLPVFNSRLQRSQSLVAFRDSLRQLSQIVKDNPLGKSLETGLGKTGAQGDAVRNQLLSIIQLTLQAASNLSATDQIGFLRKSRADILQRATDLGIPLKVVQQMLDGFGVLDRTNVTPKVGLDDTEFNHKKKPIETWLDGLERMNVEPTIKFKALVNDPVLNTVLGLLSGGKKKPSGQTDLGDLLFAPAGADGMTIPGARHPYGDKVLIHAAPGEELITNRHGEADRFRADRAAGRIPSYANGGTVQRVPGGSSYATAPGIDYDRLAAAMSAVRPMYGDVHVSGDPTAFRQTLENDKRMSSLDGVRR